MRLRITEWNADLLERQLPTRILEDYAPRIAFQLQQEISKEQFNWPVATQRKSGQFVRKGKRDIVDTGTLLNSQTEPLVAVAGRGVQLRIRWDAPYSGEVLRGGYLVGTLRNNYIAPSRDWISPALRAQDPLRFFAGRWRQISNA